MLFTFIYDFALLVFAIATFPKLIYQWIFHKKYRKSLGQRFGFGFPEIQKGSRKLIWIHSVSLGETKAIATIAKRIKKENPASLLVCSTITETGYAEALRGIAEADYHVFLPFDFLWIIRPIIKKIRPDTVILCETDFWYNFLMCCKNFGAKIYLVNGKISEKSTLRFQQFKSFAHKIFSLVDVFCVQSQLYKERFQQVGIPEKKLFVTGNIKFDGHYPRLNEADLKDWKKKIGLREWDYVLVAGSTHDPEEKIILDSLKKVWLQIPNLTLLIVPRHPERFEDVAKLLEQNNIPFTRYSQSTKKQSNVILIDSMGLLRQCYQLADLAFVGGSFTAKVGGHNIVEPSWYGVPVLYGPHMHSQPELLQLVQKYQAGIQLEPEQLAPALTNLLMHKEESQKLGAAGKIMTNDLSGASEKTYRTIFP